MGRATGIAHRSGNDHRAVGSSYRRTPTIGNVRGGSNRPAISRSTPSGRGNVKIPADGNQDELLLVEKWRDADALAEHGAQPHYTRLKALKTEYVTDTVIDRFECQE